MLSIRLTRLGRRHKPYYRVVVADSRRARDGGFVEILGHYNPLAQPEEIHIDAEKVNEWIKKGAKPSDTVRSLIKRQEKSNS